MLPLGRSPARDERHPVAQDGSTLHVVWSEWNGTDADVVYMRSTDGGTGWTGPVTIGGGSSDQFFPWLARTNQRVSGHAEK